jgi:hypothetical protein
MSLSECCRKIIVHDCLALRKKTVTLLQRGYLVKGSLLLWSHFSYVSTFFSTETDFCAKCHTPVYSPGKFF